LAAPASKSRAHSIASGDRLGIRPEKIKVLIGAADIPDERNAGRAAMRRAMRPAGAHRAVLDESRALVPKGISRQEGSCMSASRLRVYYGPEQVATEESTTATIPLRETVTLPLGEVLPLLMDAVKNRRQWVGDFFDDDVAISSDLYEVLLAYQHFRRPSA
jgi:hypothetical protein